MTQSQNILNYLKTGKSLSPIDALKKFGCFRLSGRIYDLKREGHNIETQFVTKKNKSFAVYSLKN